MIAEKTTDSKPTRSMRLLPWLNIALALLLIGIGIWYLADKVSLSDIITALQQANKGYILLAVGIMLFTMIVKAWRWQIMLDTTNDKPPFMSLFWAMALGQYVNLIVPFMRLGDVARIYALRQQTGIGMGRSLGTMVVEKAIDLIFFALTALIFIPFAILPDELGGRSPGLMLGSVAFVMLVILYLMAYQTENLKHILQTFSNRIPLKLWQRMMQLGIAGLDGLSALRSRKLTLLLLGSSLLIAMLSVLLPTVLFPAFGIKLGIVAGAMMHIVVSVISAPPTTPGRIGVFNYAAALMLYTYGITNEAAIVSYAIVFHLVVMLPQIILGSIAATRTNWHWQKTAETQALS